MCSRWRCILILCLMFWSIGTAYVLACPCGRSPWGGCNPCVGPNPTGPDWKPPYRIELSLLEQYGLMPEVLKKLQPLENKTYFSKEEFLKALESQFDGRSLTEKDKTLILDYSKLVPELSFDNATKAWTFQNWVNYRGKFAVRQKMKNVNALEIRVAPSLEANYLRIERPRAIETQKLSEQMLPVSIHGQMWWYLPDLQGKPAWIPDQEDMRPNQ